MDTQILQQVLQQITSLEERIRLLESAKAALSNGLGSFQRMVYDERGRATIVTVGGNNGGY